MKNLFFIVSSMLVLSCTDDIVENKSSNLNEEGEVTLSRLSFSSREELGSILDAMASSESNASNTRANSLSMIAIDKFESVNFESYYDLRKQEVFASMTEEQIDSIQNDPDSLEFCLEDSVVFDELFAKLLNVEREIEVNDTIFKYYDNGIALVPKKDYKELEKYKNDFSNFKSEDINTPAEIKYGSVTFCPQKLFIENEPIEDETTNNISLQTPKRATSSSYVTLPLPKNGASLTLKSNGVTISPSNIVTGKYSKYGGNGSWIQKMGGAIIGRKCMLNCKFNGHNKVQLNVIDQNYGIYTKIGVEVVKKKKRFGIWWKSRGEEIVLGWNVLELKRELSSPDELKIPKDNNSDTPAKTWPEALKLFPFQDKNEEFIVLHLPDNDYPILSSGDINSWFKQGVQSAISNASNTIKNLINGKHEYVGVYTVKNESLYLTISPKESRKTNSCFNEEIFYSKWFSGTYMLGYTRNGDSQGVNISIKPDKSTSLNRYVLYGAARHGKTWKACILTKE